MAERTAYFVEMGNNGSSIRYGFRAPATLYNNIKTDLGVKEATERTYGSIVFGLAGEKLPRLRIGMGGRFGNAANTDQRKSALVFVDPGRIEHCLDKLIGKSARGLSISSVRIPKRRVYI